MTDILTPQGMNIEKLDTAFLESLDHLFIEKNCGIDLFDEFCYFLEMISDHEELKYPENRKHNLFDESGVSLSPDEKKNLGAQYVNYFNRTLLFLDYLVKTDDPGEIETVVSNLVDYFAQGLRERQGGPREILVQHATTMIRIIFDWASVDAQSQEDPMDNVEETLGKGMADFLINISGASMYGLDGEYDEFETKNIIESMIYSAAGLNGLRQTSNVYKKQIQAVYPEMGRNELCPCGSGKKYKNCCMQ